MTLLEIDERINFIIETKRREDQHRLKDFSNLLFYGVHYGYASTQTKKPIEKNYHKIIDTLLQIKEADIVENGDKVESELAQIFK